MRSIMLVSLVMFACIADAHHAFITHYDPTQSLELRGVVVEYNMRSPHSTIVVDVEGGIGEAQRWEVETASVPHMRRMGMDQNTFESGDAITVVARPNRRPGHTLVYGIGFVTADGTELGELPNIDADGYQGSGRSGIAAIIGRWTAPFPVRTTESPLPLTSLARSAWEHYDPQLSPANTCEEITIPPLLYAPAFLTDIQIDEREVVLHHEAYGRIRTVPLNGAPRITEPTGALGVASARIDGDALVIDSTGFPASAWGLAIAAHTNGGGADVPSSTQKRVTERYSASEDGQMLLVEYTMDDPVYLTEPYSGVIEFSRVADDEQMYPFECEVESAERFSRDP